MAKWIVSRLVALAGSALIVGGCATASKPAPSRSGRVAAGYALYHGDGFSVAAPSGFKAQPAHLSGLPAGSSVKVLTAGGAPPEQANAEVFTLVNPNLQFDIDQVATNLRQADSNNPQLSDVHTSVRAVTVAGAQAARVVTESYVARYVSSQPAKGPNDRTWLMVLPKRGTLIDVVVANEPARGGNLDPTSVIDSFRLGR